MRVAAIDLGRVRVGVAVSDELGVLAHPRPYLSGKDRAGLLAALTRLASDEGVEQFLVGLPCLLDGSEGLAARQARRFAEALTRRTGLPVTLCDERLTTVEAQRRLREQGRDARQSRDRIDSASAAVLLQSWLDGQRSGAGEPR